ncbi:MAG: hypothetical protein ACYC6Y_20930 [Thermoguttaceae bacterium]
MIRWKALVRDVAVIFFLTFLGGVVIGVASAGRDLPMAAVGVSNIIFMIVGFTISGCIVKVQRFRHMFHVALAVWLLGAFNILLVPGLGLVQWAAGLVGIMIMMLIGGGISLIFVWPPDKDSQQQVGLVSSETTISDEPST